MLFVHRVHYLVHGKKTCISSIYFQASILFNNTDSWYITPSNGANREIPKQMQQLQMEILQADETL